MTYSYTVTNTGDVTLSNVVLDDTVEGILTLSDVAGDTVAVLAVGDSETASAAHTVTQAEFNAASLTNIATATGDGPTGTPVEDDDTVTVPFVQNPAIQVVKSQALTSDANLNGLPDVGDVVTYSYTVTNTGDVTLSNVVLDDTVEGILTLSDVAGDTVAVLAVGDSETASAAHTVTQAEFNAASLTNIATATGDGPTGTPVEDDDTVTVPFVQNPAIQVVKSQALTSDANLNGLPDVGDVVTYSYTVTNTGDVTLSNVVLDDTVEGILTLSDVAGDTVAVLAVGDSETASAAHTVTQAEFNAASLTNIATATGDGPTGTPVEDDDTVTVPFVQNPAIQVVKSQALTSDANLNGLPDVGDVVTYSYTVTNTGDVTLSNVVLDDTVEGILTLSDVAGDTVAVLAVGDSETASAAHTVTQAEFNAASLTNIATATGDGPTGTPVEDDDTVTVPFVQNPAIQVVKALTANADEDGSTTVTLGDTLTYTITGTNTGDVTLTNVTVDDTLTGAVDLPCAASLALDASCAVAVLYVVTQADVDAGQILNTGTVDSNETPPESDDEVVPVPQNPAIDVVKSQELTTDVNGDGQAAVGDVITYSYTVTNTGDVTLTDVSLGDDVEGPLTLSDVAGDTVAVLAVGDTETASAAHTLTQEEFAAGPVVPLPEIPGKLNAGDYVIFAQSRDGKAAETIDNGSNDAQASVSGSDNSVFGRIRSNADFSSSGQNIYYHYVGNGGTPSVPPDTLNDGKITYRFLNDNGDNFYKTSLSDPQFPGLTDGTWLPVQSDVPVGPVADVPLGDPYQYWPGNLHTVVTAASNYLQMDVAALEPFCDFGSLTGGPVEFDLTEADADGTYCTNGGVLKLSVQDVGTVTNPRSFTFLANDGLISISGQHAVIEPFALGVLAMSDLDSDSDQFPIKIAGSNFTVQIQSIVFAPMAGADVSGSDESLLCLHAIAQEVKLQGSNSEFGPNAPGCRGPVAKSLTNIATADGTSPTPVSVTVQDTDTQTVVFFSENPSPLRAAAAASDGGMTGVQLTPAMLQAAVVEGINYWRGVGIPAKRLDAVRQMDVRIADLPGPFLGFAYPDDIILIDRNAAGHGWSVASESLGAVAVRDVVTHELGHLLGFDHNDHGVMRAVLEVGVGTHPGRNRQSIMESRSQRQGQGGIQ